MENLTIRKIAEGVFEFETDTTEPMINPEVKLSSKGSFLSVDFGDSAPQTVKVTEITVVDTTDASEDETFATARELFTRLSELGLGKSSPGDSGLTSDELAALNGANGPNASNVFATMADVGPATPSRSGTVVLYTGEGTNTDGTMDQNSIKAALDPIRTDIAALSGTTDIVTAKTVNQIEIIKTGIDYGFNDWATYTPANANTVPSAGTLTATLKLQATSSLTGAFLPTGKIVGTGAYSITITGKPTANNSCYFGFGLKNGSSWGGGMYNGSTGAFSMLNYNSGSFISGAGMATQPTWAVNDIISVRIIFRGGSTYLQTAVNGVWAAEVAAPTAMKILHGGEIVVCERGTGTVDNITIKVEDAADFSNEVFMSPTGSDTNNGTYDFPLATINAAKQLTKGKGWITMLSGDYLFNSTSANKYASFLGGIKLRGERGGNIRIIGGTQITSASLEPGYTKVYSVPYTSTLNSGWVLWQHDVLDPATLITSAESHPLHRGAANRLSSMKMTWLSSLAALEASSGTRAYFYWASNVLYFTITDGSSLATNPVVVPSTTGYSFAGNDVKINNVKFLYTGAISVNNNFEVMDSSVLFGTSTAGWQYGGAVGGVFRRCEAGGINYVSGAGGDGFNSTLSVVSSLNKYCSVTSYDCWSHDNEDDGDSLHNNAESSIFGGLYEYNGGAGIASASGGHMSIMNAVLRRNTGQGLATSGTAADGGTGTNLFASGCLCANNTAGSNTAGSGFQTMTLVGCTSISGAFVTTGNNVYNCTNL